MTTTEIGPYECRSPYRDLGPVGREWAAFIAACNETPRTGDGAARSAPQAVAAPPSQPAPSPLSVDGGAR